MNRRVLTFAKDGQTYLFRYAPGCEDDVVDEIMKLAEERDCPVDWLDAATLSFQIAQYAANLCADSLLPSPDEQD
ncbi:MAG: hypothetical protein ACYS8X_04735 [Planctomycetota bacterium]|jgi:hypothetical protein